ncbi:putative transposase [Streptomyces himastatinicus ATCC 53653]|uniref:Putative transposase n=1 Tax=Streptomyces himastatinicus ATCC 53653 TaxID=457427 RepID=D9WTR9_9ACTN|nr:putative transposase [Streptomyces himastatinicus ATCC 53653]
MWSSATGQDADRGPAHDAVAGGRGECSAAAGDPGFRQVPCQGAQGHPGTPASAAAGRYAALEEEAGSLADAELHPARFRLKDGRLHLAGGIVLTVVWSRALPAEPSSVRVYQDSVGHWYCSLVVPAKVRPLPETGRVLGVDWGVKETATTTSDAHDLPHAQHGRKVQARLTRYDRMMARRRPKKGQAASRGYREAKKWRAKTYAKIARQRQDTGRKWAKRVVTDHDAIAVEDFKPRFLARSSMARKAADAAIGATKKALIEMGRKHGRDMRLVHPAHTTMDCASCGARTKHALPLSERTYTCTACGAVSPRDKNSARVMLVRAGLNPAGAEGVRPPGALLPKAA